MFSPPPFDAQHLFADRNDHHTPDGQLVDKTIRQMLGSRRDEDSVEGPALRRPEHTRTGLNELDRRRRLSVRARPEPRLGEGILDACLRPRDQLRVTLDADDPSFGPDDDGEQRRGPPDPAPTSRTESPHSGARRSSMSATVLGWEFVWPQPMSSGTSAIAHAR
jgi:hypothetical protein